MTASDDLDEPSEQDLEPAQNSAAASRGEEKLSGLTEGVAGSSMTDGDRTQAADHTKGPFPLGMPIQLDPPQREDSIGRMESYEILSVVGRGGMGIVARAFDEQLHRFVAIKVMSERLITSERAQKRFLREARAAAGVNHPNVVTIHAVAETNGLPYLVMEYVDGQPLQSRIRQGTAMPYEDILRIGSQIAAGLSAAHRHGIIHRDVKPGNVMLEDGIERVKLTDFGLARLLVENSDLTSLGDMVGTPAYMSPEQVNGEDLTPSSDLFSLGCVLYAMFSGKSPFHSSSSFASANRVRELEPPPLSSIVKEVPPEFERLVTRLLSKEPNARPESAEAVAEQLLHWSAEIHRQRLPGSKRHGTVSSEPRPSPFKRIVASAGAVLVLALLSGYAVIKRRPSDAPAAPIQADDALSDGVLRVHSSDGEYATLRAAIAASRPDTTIQLVAGTYRGPFEIADNDRFRGLQIVGQPGVKLVGPPGAPVIRIVNVENCQLRDLTVESGVSQIGANISGNCAGLTITQVHFKARQSEQTTVGLVRIDLGGSGTRDAPIEITECEFDAGAVALVIGSHNPSEGPVAHIQAKHNHIRASSTNYGIPVVIQGRVSDVEVERNLLRRGLGGLSVNLPVANGAERVFFRYNTMAQIEIPFFLNHSMVDQDVRIEKNLIVGGRTLHATSESPTHYDTWFTANDWLPSVDAETELVESMFTIVPSSVLRSTDPKSPEFLQPSDAAPEELSGISYHGD